MTTKRWCVVVGAITAIVLGELARFSAAFTLSAVGGASKCRRSAVSMMASIAPGSTCLVLGSGPLHLLTAKQAALAGYKTCVFTAQEPTDALELIYDGKFMC